MSSAKSLSTSSKPVKITSIAQEDFFRLKDPNDGFVYSQYSEFKSPSSLCPHQETCKGLYDAASAECMSTKGKLTAASEAEDFRDHQEDGGRLITDYRAAFVSHLEAVSKRNTAYNDFVDSCIACPVCTSTNISEKREDALTGQEDLVRIDYPSAVAAWGVSTTTKSGGSAGPI